VPKSGIWHPLLRKASHFRGEVLRRKFRARLRRQDRHMTKPPPCCVSARKFAARFARISGFTMVELLVTMGVAAILTAVAVPAFRTFILNDRDSTQLNSLVYSLNYARSEAVKRDSAAGVVVCPSSDAATCSNTANWAGGWIVLDLAPAAGQPAVLQTVPALAGTNTLAATGNATGIKFVSSGMVTPQVLTTIKICDTRGAAFARELEVNQTGRIAASQSPGKTVGGAGLACP
jgi:type IV fimbrial biogenesis protein FimT